MRGSRWVAAVALVPAVLLGCGNGLDGRTPGLPPPVMDDAGPASDAGRDADLPDAGTDGGFDAGFDAGPTCMWYRDIDRDGFGDPGSSVEVLCSEGPVADHVENDLDCYDGERSANPTASGWYGRDRGDGSWDWNCDGEDTLEWPDFSTCVGAEPGGPGWALIGYECTGDVCASWSEIPACGGLADFRSAINCATGPRYQKCR